MTAPNESKAKPSESILQPDFSEAFLNAMRHKNVGLVRLLVRADRNLVNTPAPSFSPLITAVMKDSLGIVKVLVENGADVEASGNRTKETALHYAATRGLFSIVKYLVENGADVNAEDYAGRAPLLGAIHWSRSGTAEFLIANGANVNVVGNAGTTPLHVATQGCEIDIVRLLLEVGAKVDSQNNQGWTPLHHSIRCSNLEIVKLLMTAGADPMKKTKDWETALDILNRHTNPKITEFISSYTRSS